MLNFFRRSASMVKIIFGVILFLTCISMVVTLIPGLTGVSTDPAVTQVVAEVGDRSITTTDVQKGVQQMAQSNQLPAEMQWLYTEQVLDGLVIEKASVLEAQRMGLRVTQDDLVSRLRLIPDLYPGGKFIGKDQYEGIVYQRFGTTVPEFESRFSDNLLIEKLRQVVTDSVDVSPEEVRNAFVKDNERLVLHYVYLEPSNFKKEVNASDAALQEYFGKNPDKYKVPEQRKAKILLLETEKIKQTIKVTDAEERKYYQDNLDSYRLPERVAVHHILYRATDKEPEKLAAAKKKAEDALKRLKAGAKFEDVAKKESEDTVSGAKGGDLDWVTRGQTVPNFEKAAFFLPVDSLSDPIQTEYGIHILKVTAHEQARLKPFEEVRENIHNALLDQKVANELAASADQAASDWRKDPAKASDVAAKYSGTVVDPPPFSHGELVQGIPGSQPLAEDAFVIEKGQIGRAVPVTSGYAIPQLEEIIAPRVPALAEVKQKVHDDFLDAKAAELAQAKALELAQAIEKQDKRDLDRQARAMGLTSKTSDPTPRTGALPSIGSLHDLGPKLDTMKPGEIAGPVPAGGGQLVYQLETRQEPVEAEFTVQKEGIRQRLVSQKQQAAFALFQDGLKTTMKESGDIKIHQAVLDRLNSSAAAR